MKYDQIYNIIIYLFLPLIRASLSLFKGDSVNTTVITPRKIMIVYLFIVILHMYEENSLASEIVIVEVKPTQFLFI